MYIHCEDSEAQSQVVRETFNPVWNAEFIFYRTEPRKNPVVIQVSDKYYFCHPSTKMGECNVFTDVCRCVSVQRGRGGW